MRKRSRYRPGVVRLDNMAFVKAGLQPLRDIGTEGDSLRMKNHAAMDELVHGRGGPEHVNVVREALNMTEGLARIRIGSDWRAEIQAGQGALAACVARAAGLGGRLVFTGPELTAVNLAIAIHDAQLDACNVSDLERALKIVRDDIRKKRSQVMQVPAC